MSATISPFSALPSVSLRMVRNPSFEAFSFFGALTLYLRFLKVTFRPLLVCAPMSMPMLFLLKSSTDQLPFRFLGFPEGRSIDSESRDDGGRRISSGEASVSSEIGGYCSLRSGAL